MKKIKFLYNDACQTNGEDPSRMFAVYNVVISKHLHKEMRVCLSIPKADHIEVIRKELKDEYKSVPSGWLSSLKGLFKK